MGTDPEPDIVLTVLNSQSAMIDPGPSGPKLAYFLEVQRRMGAVIFEEFEVLSGYRLDSFWQVSEKNPETAGGAMHL
jgi:hypothetical protein